MEALRTLAILLPLSLSSGINLYATILVVGLTIRLGLVQNPPAGLEALANPVVILVAALFYVIEFLADKIQFVDNAWDLIHTFIRPLGAAVLTWAALSKVDPTIAVLGALAMGSVALISHSSKAGTRVALNVASPLENVSNTGLSLFEDALAAGLAFLAMTHPFTAAGIALLVLAILILVVPQLLRWAWFSLRALAAWVGSLRRQQASSDPLPPGQVGRFGPNPVELSIRCKAQGIKQVGGRTGYLVLAGPQMCFAYRRRGHDDAWCINRAQVKTVRLAPGILVNVLKVDYLDQVGKQRTARFVFFKDRALLAEQAALRLSAAGVPSMPPAGLPARVP